ncbi:hypothetical protein [Proteiniclasticum sp. QWL-01]|uniref:hypothetical protein n=1 Tax=Proteiniclasticum sp. QWL-01 TaxID=3036945 RepID=UPI0021FE6AB8|nr:hypothetical protein [Proteiniclasticum sp. QWL-01]UUM11630.1 hypothetical protein NQU17_13470 [Clostridiaceae bacterium HFYG-1003]WFF73108.1 hypothetical protein P6M73_01180 [Proteiniclasticum sp. QWL-01]
MEKQYGITIGLFLIFLSILLIEIEDKLRKPEIVIYFISAVLTIGVILLLYSFVKRKDRKKRQEN